MHVRVSLQYSEGSAGCSIHRLQPWTQGQHTRREQPWALSSSEWKTCHAIKPCAWAWTQFHLPMHYGSSALCQCHFTNFHFDIITSMHTVYMALCTLKVCSFSKLKAQHTESSHVHTVLSMWWKRNEYFALLGEKSISNIPAWYRSLKEKISENYCLAFVHPPIQLFFRLAVLHPSSSLQSIQTKRLIYTWFLIKCFGRQCSEW